MTDFNVDLLFKYPLISAIDSKRNEFRGYITVNVSFIVVAKHIIAF